MPELMLAAAANNERHELEMEMLAWHAANVMNCWAKKTIQPSDLLGKKKKIQFQSFAELKAYYREAGVNG